MRMIEGIIKTVFHANVSVSDGYNEVFKGSMEMNGD